MIGTTLGNFRVVERLGDGGMGAVYRAVDEMLDREVAIKVLKPELARNAALIERFRLEAVALARLNHPHIAILHGLERHGDSLVMIMEYVRGDTLEDMVNRSGPLAWKRASELCIALLDALDHAHNNGVVHRDVKPANVMLSSAGMVKVMDFGIARLMGKSRQTKTGHAVGTPMYMAPEQLRGEEVDGRTDLYAVGAVLFELVTGRLAFEADSDFALMMKQLNEPTPNVTSLVAGVPSELDAIIQRATAKAPEHRFPNALAFREALASLVSRQHNTPLSASSAAAASSPAHVRPASSTSPLYADWRSWATVGALLVAITISVRTFLPPGEGGESVGGVGTMAPSDSPATAAPVAVTFATDTITPMPTAVPLSGGNPSAAAKEGSKADLASGLTTNPAAPTTGTVRTPTALGRAPSAAPRRAAVLTGGESGLPRVLPDSLPAVRQTERSGDNAAPSQRDDASASVSAIQQAILSFASAVSDGRVGVVQGALQADGETASQWMALLKEGRLSMRLAGAPEITPNGARAGATFTTSLGVRSPFGAVKRREARFAAELARSGDSWRVVTLRPLEALSLK